MSVTSSSYTTHPQADGRVRGTEFAAGWAFNDNFEALPYLTDEQATIRVQGDTAA